MHADPTDATSILLATTSASDESAIRRLLDRAIGPEAIAENTARIGRAADPGMQRPVRLLLVRIGREILALPVAAVDRVVLPVPVVPIPHRSDEVLLGIAAVDGDLVLVCDLARLLDMQPHAAGQPPGGQRQRRIVVFGSPQRSGPTGTEQGGEAPGEGAREVWAFHADSVLGVDAFDEAAFIEAPLTLEGGSTGAAALVPLGEGSDPDESASLLDVAAVLALLRRRLE